MEGNFTEASFDESLLSALESSFAHYLAASTVSARKVDAEKEKLKSLIGDISHQTKTPIANILLYTQLLKEQPGNRDCLEALEGQTKKLQSLIDALVKTSRLETGVIALHPEPGELWSVMTSAVSQLRPKAEEKGVQLQLPVDTVVAGEYPNPIDAPVDVETVDVTAIPADKEGLDIGEKTRALFADAIKNAKTVVWNGPMGVFENPTLAKGTIAVAQALADSDAVTIVGGGDSAAACEQLGFADKITHISTGGGASLEFLEGLELPGIACLQDK